MCYTQCYCYLLTVLAKGTTMVTHLDGIALRYLSEGSSTATKRTYSTGKQSFTSFCNTAGNWVTPATESVLLLFVSHLASKNISHTTIKVFLAADGHMHVIGGIHKSLLTPRLQLVLGSIKRTQAISIPCRMRLPITLQSMCGIKDCLSRQL